MKFIIAIVLVAGCLAELSFADNKSKQPTGGAKGGNSGKPSSTTAQRPSGKPTTSSPQSTKGGRPQSGGINANAYCFECLMRTNNRDLFSNPVDCHTYFQCLYLNETGATGILRFCQHGTFFNEKHLACVAEGAVPCQPSPCDNPSVAALGCYQLPGESCREYVSCSTRMTQCCPEGTRFDPTTCGCLSDSTCLDYCQPAITPTTVSPVVNATSNSCTDAFGNTLVAVSGNEGAFQLGDYTLPCAPGSTFDLNTCGCSTFVNLTQPGASGRACQLWLPFDTDINDKSALMLTSFAYGNALLDTTTSFTGAGSLSVNGGRVEIPGLKSIELNNPAGVSWCFAFLCSGGSCSTNGGILSNNQDMTATIFTFIGAIFGPNTLLARVQTDENNAQLTGSVNQGGWNSACVVNSDNTTVTLFVNGAQVATAPLSGIPSTIHCPYVVGNDQFYGDFIGNIDNVLVCNTPLSTSEVSAYSSGDLLTLQNAGLIPGAAQPTPFSSSTSAPSTSGSTAGSTPGSTPASSTPGSTSAGPARGGRPTTRPAGGNKPSGGQGGLQGGHKPSGPKVTPGRPQAPPKQTPGPPKQTPGKPAGGQKTTRGPGTGQQPGRGQGGPQGGQGGAQGGY